MKESQSQPEKKSVLITGCGKGGIGHALALEFKSKDYTVLTTLLPHEPREHLTNHGIHVFNANVTRDDEIEKLKADVQAIVGEERGLDVLVNNAGICYTMPATDTSLAEVTAMFAVNVFGPMRMVRVFHPLLIRSRGKIVNIGSVGGVVPYVYGSSYNATKAALHHWGNTLRVEMKPFGVTVTNIISGEVSTNILKTDQRASRTLPPDSIYAPMEEDFRRHVGRVPQTTTPHQYARSVVSEITKDSPRAWFWTGSRSFLVWFLDSFGWRTVWDGLFTREFGLGKLVAK